MSSDGAAGLQAWVTIEVAGSDEVFRTTDVVVDTGFTGWMTLPETVIERMGLDLYGRRPAVLANGETTILDLYFRAHTVARFGSPCDGPPGWRQTPDGNGSTQRQSPSH